MGKKLSLIQKFSKNTGLFFKQPQKSHWLVEFTLVASLALLTGAIGGFAAIAFRYVVDWGWLGFHVGLDKAIGSTDHGYWIILLPAFGLFFVSLITRFCASEVKGDGATQALEALSIKNGIIQPKVSFWSNIAAAITLGSGGSAGREGPIALIGATFGSNIGQLLRMPPQYTSLLLGCGAGAGIAATFNAPIAGAFFGLEIMLGTYVVGSIVPVLLASVTGVTVFNQFMGSEAVLEIPHYSEIGVLSVFSMLILGFFTGLTGHLFVRGVEWAGEKNDQLILPFWMKAFVGGLLVGIIGYFFPDVLSVGYPILHKALRGEFILATLMFLFIAKYLVTVITLGSGGSGGGFAPSLFLGGMLGGAYGQILHFFYPAIATTPQVYAAAGMAGLLAATAKAPFVAATILLEVTGDYRITAHAMAAAASSYFLFSALSDDSMYTIGLSKRGIPIPYEMYHHPLSAKIRTICFSRKIRKINPDSG